MKFIAGERVEMWIGNGKVPTTRADRYPGDIIVHRLQLGSGRFECSIDNVGRSHGTKPNAMPMPHAPRVSFRRFVRPGFMQKSEVAILVKGQRVARYPCKKVMEVRCRKYPDDKYHDQPETGERWVGTLRSPPQLPQSHNENRQQD